MNLRIRCCLCGVLIKDMTVYYDQMRCVHILEVKCHGETDAMVVTDFDIAATDDFVGQMANQEGVAFKSAHLLNA